MKKIKYIVPVAILFLLLNIKNALADTYLVNLYYDAPSKTLSFDKFAPEKVSLDKTARISIIDFTQESENSIGPYILTFYDITKNEIISTKFNKKDGAFKIIVPYFSIATTLKIFEASSNKELLSADISSFSTCNGNGICEYEKGETGKNCLGDCATSKPVFSQQTSSLLNENGGMIKDPKTGEILLKNASDQIPPDKNYSVWLIISATILFLIILILIVYKKFIKKRT